MCTDVFMAFWQVARSMILHLNMTRMLPASVDDDCCSHLFLSLQDLISVVSKHKGVAIQMLEKLPDVLLSWAKGTHLYTHVMELWDAVSQQLAMEYLDSIWKQVSSGTAYVNGLNSSLFSKNVSAAAAVKELMRKHRMQVALFHAYANHHQPPPAASNWGSTHDSIHWDKSPSDEVLVKEDTTVKNHQQVAPGGRRLLQQQQSFGDTNVVDMYSSLVASTKGFSNLAI